MNLFKVWIVLTLFALGIVADDILKLNLLFFGDRGISYESSAKPYLFSFLLIFQRT